MQLDGILNKYKKCKQYSLNENVRDYLRYIDEEPFYIPPTFSDVKTDAKLSTLNPKFILFSAPGATGKSSLAKYISNRFNAIYWNLAKVKVGTNSFAGSILSAVSAQKYSEFIGDLNSGKALLIIDAFDEAEIVSGRKMINSFIDDISNSLASHTLPPVFLLARTETAQYIASFCAANNIAVAHYEIGFFNEDSAKDFILKIVSGKAPPSVPEIECVKSYYDVIKQNITADESTSFLGYAPVLEAIATHIKMTPNRKKLISALSTQKDCVSIIMKIMDDLLHREQAEKVVCAFKEKCLTTHPEFSGWDYVYSPEEQLVRIIHYILFRDTSFSNYRLAFLPPQLVDDYQELLDAFLPQHPFVRNSSKFGESEKGLAFTGPAFRDYSLAKIILDPVHSELAELYFEESQSQSYFPSQIFFDCYVQMSNGAIHPEHISYVFDSYKAKATAYERPYLQCSEVASHETEGISCIALFGMVAGKQHVSKHENQWLRIAPVGFPLKFEQLVNVSIDSPHMEVRIGHPCINARICNSSVVCKRIVWSTKNITIESYEPESCLLVASDGFEGDLVSYDIANSGKLMVCAPNLNSYYKFIPFEYDFNDASKVDIFKFIHALRCILIEFRTHRKDTLAKSAERIDFVTVGNSEIKQQALDYLKYCGIIYEEAHLYKINESRLQQKGINYNALSRMDVQQLDSVFKEFCEWVSN